MTNTEFLTAIAEGTINDELIAYAKAAIEKNAASAEKRKTKAAEKAEKRDEERKPVVAAILAALGDEPKTAQAIADEIEFDVTRQLVSTLLRPYIADGTVVKANVGKLVGYAKA